MLPSNGSYNTDEIRLRPRTSKRNTAYIQHSRHNPAFLARARCHASSICLYPVGTHPPYIPTSFSYTCHRICAHPCYRYSKYQHTSCPPLTQAKSPEPQSHPKGPERSDAHDAGYMETAFLDTRSRIIPTRIPTSFSYTCHRICMMYPLVLPTNHPPTTYTCSFKYEGRVAEPQSSAAWTL